MGHSASARERALPRQKWFLTYLMNSSPSRQCNGSWNATISCCACFEFLSSLVALLVISYGEMVLPPVVA